MHRFHFDPQTVSADNQVILSREESYHALKVLRLRPGDVVELLDGQGRKIRGVVASADGAGVRVALDRRASGEVPTEGPTIVLAAAVIKPERMELLVQKASELGVSRIVPMLAERSVVRMPRERWAQKTARWNKIAAEACKQSGRAQLPRVESVISPDDFWGQLERPGIFLIPTLATAGASLPEALSPETVRAARQAGGPIVLAVGPEGDFTPREVRLAVQKGAVPVTLGEAVMRSETAALYLVSVVQFAWLKEAQSRLN